MGTLELPAPAKHFLWPRRPSSIMSTLADELLNDFEDSGDENEDRGLQDDDQANGNGTNGQTHEHSLKSHCDRERYEIGLHHLKWSIYDPRQQCMIKSFASALEVQTNYGHTRYDLLWTRSPSSMSSNGAVQY